MIRNSKRISSLLIATVMLVTLAVPAMAKSDATEIQVISESNALAKINSVADAGFVYTISKTEAEVNQEFAEAMSQIEKSITPRGPSYEYKTEYFPKQYKVIKGYAGNQLSGGYRFQTGGGFYFSDSGGPSVSASINLSLPAPFNFISFAVGMGTNSSSSGRIITVPNTTDYFKLYVEKSVTLSPYAVYERRKNTNDPWKCISSGAAPVVTSSNAYGKKVG